MLQHIARSRPNHLVIAADFDELPEVVIPGENAPLVASTVCSALPGHHCSALSLRNPLPSQPLTPPHAESDLQCTMNYTFTTFALSQVPQ